MTAICSFKGLHNAQQGSEHVVDIGVNFLECFGGALIKNTLRFEAFVLIESVGSHASSEGTDIGDAELSKNSLSGGVLVFSWEAGKKRKRNKSVLTRRLSRQQG